MSRNHQVSETAQVSNMQIGHRRGCERWLFDFQKLWTAIFEFEVNPQDE
jgi:hypothetical protein